MRILLQPSQHPRYGQDIILRDSASKLGLVPWLRTSGDRYPDPLPEVTLVVSHHAVETLDSVFIKALPPSVRSVVHFHWQWEYCARAEQDNVATALTHAFDAIVPAEFMRRSLGRRFPGINWHVVGNGCDERFYKPASRDEKSAFREQRGIPVHAPLGIVVTRLEPSKGSDILKVLAPLLKSHQTHLLLQYPAFVSPKLSRTYSAIADEIVAASDGYVHPWPDSDSQSPRPVRYCDFMVHPSLCEVAPLTVIESLVAGVPVIATDSTPFYTEELAPIVPRGSLALINLPTGFRSDDCDWRKVRLSLDQNIDLARAILAALPSRNQIESAGGTSLSMAIQSSAFTNSAMVQNFATLYDEIELRK